MALFPPSYRSGPSPDSFPLDFALFIEIVTDRKTNKSRVYWIWSDIMNEMYKRNQNLNKFGVRLSSGVFLISKSNKKVITRTKLLNSCAHCSRTKWKAKNHR